MYKLNIKTKSRLVFLSPHFDDVIFSCAGLISEFKNKTEIIVINIFTRQTNPYTFSARKYLNQCGYKNFESLYAARENEDASIFKKLNIRIINLNLEDALFRKNQSPNRFQKILGKYIPEFLHTYPTYRFHVSRGRIKNQDTNTVKSIKLALEDLKLTKDDFLFSPAGIGGHVDHVIVRKVADNFAVKTNLVQYADYPYVLKSQKLIKKFSEYPTDWNKKEKLIKGYKSQFKAVFNAKLNKFNEYYSDTETPFLTKKSRLGNVFKTLAILISLFVIMASVIRGNPGNPNVSDLNKPYWRDNGPLELSPERGRFGLLYSLIEDKSFYFSINLARFVIPDLGFKNGHYVSLFAPGVSYLAMPGYLVGRYFGISQIGAFATSSFFGIINLLLIYLITKKFTSNKIASFLSGAVFLFSTPALAYSVNLYQHNISTFLILFSIYLLLRFNNFWSLACIWFLCAMSIPVDYPNLFLMFPIGLFATGKLFDFQKIKSRLNLTVKIVNIFSILSVIIPLGFFLWFNQMSYNNPLQFSGTVDGVHAINDKGQPYDPKITNPQQIEEFINPNQNQGKKSAVGFFKSRNILNGLYIHILSPDRGIITFTPVILLGIFGIVVLYKNKNKYLAMLLGVVGANLFLYSMWGDPWGGWAFGSRYMIPSYAIMSIFLGVALSKFNRKWYFIIPFWILLIYSIGVNTLGALTTSTNPPKAESLALEQISGRRERYSYDRNWEFLNNQGTKSFVYHVAGYKYMTPVQYYYLIAGSIAFLATILTISVVLNKNENE